MSKVLLELNSSTKLMIYPLKGMRKLKFYCVFRRIIVNNLKRCSFLGEYMISLDNAQNLTFLQKLRLVLYNLIRINELRKFYLDAKSEDWELLAAGQCVQIIKKDEFEVGKLQFGTEVVSSKDGSITCLLGASPGASTATYVMLNVIEKAFPELVNAENKKNIKGHGANVEKWLN